MASIYDQRSRLRFETLERDSSPDGRCRITVSLEWSGGLVFRGSAEGTTTLEGETRTAALATVRAAIEATEERLSLTLMGVKAIRAFDAWVVIVSVRAETDEKEYNLIGAYACPEAQTTRGAVLAALDASNRILERYMLGA